MVNITRQGDSDQYGVVSISADNRTDVNTLATEYAQGSTCFVIEDSSVWMLGGDKQWHEV